jgi:hypothetical protein
MAAGAVATSAADAPTAMPGTVAATDKAKAAPSNGLKDLPACMV